LGYGNHPQIQRLKHGIIRAQLTGLGQAGVCIEALAQAWFDGLVN